MAVEKERHISFLKAGFVSNNPEILKIAIHVMLNDLFSNPQYLWKYITSIINAVISRCAML